MPCIFPEVSAGARVMRSREDIPSHFAGAKECLPSAWTGNAIDVLRDDRLPLYVRGGIVCMWCSPQEWRRCAIALATHRCSVAAEMGVRLDGRITRTLEIARAYERGAATWNEVDSTLPDCNQCVTDLGGAWERADEKRRPNASALWEHFAASLAVIEASKADPHMMSLSVMDEAGGFSEADASVLLAALDED